MSDDRKVLEQKIKELEAENARFKVVAEENENLKSQLKNMEDSSNRPPLRASETVTIGDGYLFEVRPRSKDSTLPPKQIRCCDESEALRWYIGTTEDPKHKGKQLDSVMNPLSVECLDEAKRNKSILEQHIGANIRAKVDRGVPLSKSEQDLYEQQMANKIGT